MSIKPITIPALLLLAAVGLAAPLTSKPISFEFTNVPTGLNLTVGTDFIFTWEPQDSRETIQLAVTAWDPVPFAYTYNPITNSQQGENYGGGFTIAGRCNSSPIITTRCDSIAFIDPFNR